MLARATALVCSVLAFTTITACGGSDGGDDGGDDVPSTSLTIDNASSYILLEINLSPIDADDWGGDLLGSDTLDPGDTLVVSDLDCDIYDIRILDDSNTECILENVDLCFDDSIWEIDDTELALCAF